MKILITAILIILPATVVATAQTRRDVCPVYVVDVSKAKKAIDNFRETGNAETDAKALAVGQTIFPEFRPIIGEEELTTETYHFPGSDLTITASVYYTDESMASARGSDSMLLGIVLSRQPQRDAIQAENNAVSEVTENGHLDKVRAKTYAKVNGRLYLLVIECSGTVGTKSK
jgi:hypothetical protein